MYRILLVEDEATVREGIVRKIDWSAHGFVLAGACENGKQALELLEEEPVEAIITDINMPVMDGLTLAGTVQERWPDTRVVILTGFDDFSYAQSAIRYRVNDYILKPITARQLRELLDKLRQELDAQLSESDLVSARAALKEKFLHRVLSEEATLPEMEQKIRELALDLPSGRACAVLLRLDNVDSLDLTSLAGLAAGYGEICQYDNGRLVFLCGGESPEACAGECLHQAAKALGAITAVTGPTVDHVGLLVHSVEAAKKAWEHVYRYPSGQLYAASRLTAASVREEADTGEARRRLFKGVKLLNRQLCDTSLDAFFSFLRESGWQREGIVNEIRKLVLQLSEYAEEQQWSPPADILERLERQPDLDAARQCVEDYLRTLLDTGEQQGDSALRQGNCAVEYIKENFHRPDLSLQDITTHLAVSTSYFSALFKNHTGVTFVEFLTRLRMNKAQELLATTDLKNYEVAAAVGYDDPGYFRSLFKKSTGQSPSEYRKEQRR